MAMKLPTAEEMFEETVQKVSSSPEEWLKFLNTASRVYQYDFVGPAFPMRSVCL